MVNEKQIKYLLQATLILIDELYYEIQYILTEMDKDKYETNNEI